MILQVTVVFMSYSSRQIVMILPVTVVFFVIVRQIVMILQVTVVFQAKNRRQIAQAKIIFKIDNMF